MGIREELEDARARTLELALDLSDAQWMGPRLDIVNPMRWELGHLAWFQELWTLRRPHGAASIRADGAASIRADASASLRADADALYDSAAVAHHTRWDLPLPDRSATLEYLSCVLARSLDRIPRPGGLQPSQAEPANPAAERAARPYFHRLALFHEDMHGEALTYTRQTLAYAAPRALVTASPAERADANRGALPGDALVPAARYLLGATPQEPFVFDNEKWAHPVDVAAFRIARAPVTNEEYLRFVAAGGYETPTHWSLAGWRWRTAVGAHHPVYWQREAGVFCVRRYDRLAPIEPHQPVEHVCAHEADAYCRWAQRRLPREAEWELAASTPDKRRYPWGDAPPTPAQANLDCRFGGPVDVAAFAAGDSAYGCRQMIGNVWEWTASDLRPFPGFVVDPYKEYSEPWFSTPHRILRGGCWATRARLLRNTWRNFYPPDRRDVLAGFRTCALP